jgi:hypothetical protein
MVRNVDEPEAVVLYHEDVWFDQTSRSMYSEFKSLLDECNEIDTAVVVLASKSGGDEDEETRKKHLLPSYCTFLSQVHAPPSPHDLLRALSNVQIQPRPFGGSSGFGARQLLDPPRSPMPARTVVLCTTLDQTRAARLAGARVICIEHEPLKEENYLADAIISLEELDGLWLEDISTPGSFWLNPPQPCDDEGNRVDPDQVAKFFANKRTIESYIESAATSNDDNLSNEDLKRILADLDPL